MAEVHPKQLGRLSQPGKEHIEASRVIPNNCHDCCTNTWTSAASIVRKLFWSHRNAHRSEPRPAAESRNRQNRNPVCDPDSDSGSDPKLSARGAASSDSVAIAETNANPVCHSNAIFNTHPDVLYFLSPSLKLT
jgi:hypothetical protein